MAYNNFFFQIKRGNRSTTGVLVYDERVTDERNTQELLKRGERSTGLLVNVADPRK